MPLVLGIVLVVVVGGVIALQSRLRSQGSAAAGCPAPPSDECSPPCNNDGTSGGGNMDPIATVAANAGFSGSDLVTAVAIALAESGGDPGAVGDKALAPTKGPSIGLWQINIGSKAHPEYASVDLTDPQTNANAAYAVYSAAGSFRPWATFDPRDGSTPKYLAHLDTANGMVAA